VKTKTKTERAAPPPSPLPPHLAGQAFLSNRQVAALLGVCGKTLRKWVANGQFPRPIVVGAVYRWRAETVVQFLARAEGVGHA
jgi:excisionase family DNA binding protein